MYMWRALQLAKNGEGRVSPNPMVGAVIVADGRIIGEGFHAFYGGPHAEVNAINSVKEADRPLLKESTIYVTLEPCSHYGKTPPCANLIKETGIPRVVIGSLDPNPKVAGNGVRILEEAGIMVEEGILREECVSLNPRFMKAHTSQLPYILLKWARSSDGFMAGIDEKGMPYPVKFSSSLSSVWVHRLRAGADAIVVGANTERIDKPLLTTRLWAGNSPRKYVAHKSTPLEETLLEMRRDGITGIIVEGGPTLLREFIKKGYWDEIREEISPKKLREGLRAPEIPDNAVLRDTTKCRDNIIRVYQPQASHLLDVKKK
ncbi:MAG: bifunctional diaminohydroxyphosphoribosylaminopyrimidine deaminase/5-amino-6-(5-phosphoribosylamino)uracil reductase RibD [Muribaculaceae bacterium]|nr:bifunctional diaminohydroxyphosphoribosylaminopyrimidine deaminase/5-amino-6-(5-phosphoribosylamino)uracil reductase RibD [Muribaculaceae bacterium]